jgi:flagellar motor switch protein FliN
VTERVLLKALVEELAAVAAAMVGVEPHLEHEVNDSSPVWSIPFGVKGSLEGRVVLAVPVADAARLTSLMLGFDEPPADDVVADSLREIAQQVASAATAKHGAEVTITVSETIASGPPAPADAEWTVINLGELLTHVATWATLTPAETSPSAPNLATPPPAELPSSVRSRAAGPGPVPGNLDLILDIELPLWVRFGETKMTMQALTKISPGATIDLDRTPEDPVDLMVNDTVIARGEVVVVAGNYGVRVTEVVSTTDRIRSMSG